MTISDDMIAPTMKLLAMGIDEDQHFAAGESGVAGLAGVLVALGDETLKRAVGLDANSRILVFGTEGATDPEIYRQLTGISPDTLGA
jgi:diaminopropionate ammonia-lyase